MKKRVPDPAVRGVRRATTVFDSEGRYHDHLYWTSDGRDEATFWTPGWEPRRIHGDVWETCDRAEPWLFLPSARTLVITRDQVVALLDWMDE